MELYQPLLAIDWNLLFSAVTVLVLFLVLKRFFFGKVHDFMAEREKAIGAALQNAAYVNEEAQNKLENYEAKIAGAEKESRRILKTARDEAKLQAQDIIEKAQLKADGIIEQSHRDMEKERLLARKELQGEISSLAILAASRIIEKELSAGDQEEIINEILKEAEARPWN